MRSEWPTVKLEDVCRVTDGAHKSPKTVADGLPIASVKDLRRYGVDIPGCRRIGVDDFRELVRSGCSPCAGDVLVAKDGSVLETVCVYRQPEEIVLLSSVAIVRPGQRVDADYLRYFLEAPVTKAMLKTGYVSGSALPRMILAAFKRMPLPLPPLAYQRAVSGVMRLLDDKIELNRKMSQTLDEMLLSEFSARFARFDGIRDTPAGWSVEDVGTVVEVRGGTTPSTKNSDYWSDGVHCFCTPKDMSQLQAPLISTTERRVTDEGLKKTGSGLLPVGTVLMSSRAPIGYVAMALCPVAVNQGIIAMVCSGRITPSFAICWTRLHQAEIVARANGSTFLEISKGNFKTIPMLVPDDDELRDFDSLASLLLDRMAVCERQSRTLVELRDALLPRLLSGELRIPDAEKVVEEVV